MNTACAEAMEFRQPSNPDAPRPSGAQSHWLRVLLVEDHPARCQAAENALRRLHHQIVAKPETTAQLDTAVDRYQPELILLALDAMSSQVVEHLQALQRHSPRPVIVFARHSDARTIRSVVHAGVSAFVADDIRPERLESIIEVALARFEAFQSMRRELEDTKLKLADRRDIEKAKGLLMKRRGLDENKAHEVLRSMAMDRNLRLGDAARAVTAAAELL